MKPMNMCNQGATVVPIRDEESGSSIKTRERFSLLSHVICLVKEIGIEDHRKVVHSIKVGIALALVSLLYLLQPLYDRVGENAMWAIMTVVVVFEFTAGATLSKGLNRGIGTLLGGGLGCLAAILAQKVGGTGSAIAICISVFIFGAAATYYRLIPSIKKKFDYGFLVFILTFNLVAVSGFRGENIINLAGERLSTIAMGFLICVFTSLFVFPVWAGDELHRSLVSKFDKLALSIEECLKEYFRETEGKPEGQASTHLNMYKSVLHSKAADEAMANFARWEPWHGKFGFTYPWNKYLRIGELLRELAASVLTLRECLQSHQQSPMCLRLIAKEPCEEMGTQICSTLRELSNDIFKMRKFRRQESIFQSDTLQTTGQELHSLMRTFVRGTLASENGDVGDLYPIATFVFMLMEIVYKVERLIKEVEELGGPADLHTREQVLMKSVLVINLDVKDNHEEAAVGARLAGLHLIFARRSGMWITFNEKLSLGWPICCTSELRRLHGVIGPTYMIQASHQVLLSVVALAKKYDYSICQLAATESWEYAIDDNITAFERQHRRRLIYSISFY